MYAIACRASGRALEEVDGIDAPLRDPDQASGGLVPGGYLTGKLKGAQGAQEMVL
jgi:hypothetical protein